jgi:hypothetical protein
MNGPDVSTAITQALIQGGSQWLISTIVAFMPALWTLTLMLHLGRPYVLRTLRRCGLRLGADVWWMSYLLIRDGLMVVTFGLSWIFFQPNIVTSVSLPLTGSLAAVCLLLALAVKLVMRMDDNVQAYRLTTVFLVLGATLYYGPQVFAIEATSQVHLAGFAQAFTTTSNTNVALALTWISLVAVTGVLGWLFVRASMFASRKLAERTTSPVPTTSRSPVPTA